MAKSKSDLWGCLEIIIPIVFFCGLPYSITLFIPLLIIGTIVYIYNKITGKGNYNNDIKGKKLISTNHERKDKGNKNKDIFIPIIDNKATNPDENNSMTEVKWKDKYGVEYSNNRQILEYYSPNINLTEYKVIKGCKIIKRYSFNKELNIDNSECIDVFAYGNNLRTIVLPDTIELIEDQAFWGCEQLQTIIIPNGMIDYFIYICPSMKEFFIEQDKRISSKLIKGNCDVKQEIEGHINKYIFYIQNENEILFSFYRSFKEQSTISECVKKWNSFYER